MKEDVDTCLDEDKKEHDLRKEIKKRKAADIRYEQQIIADYKCYSLYRAE